MPTGRVKWFDNRKGYGFIEQESGEDVFVHHSSIVADGFRTLNDGEMVRFEVIQGPKGLLSRNVMRLDAVEEETRRETGQSALEEGAAESG
jgi:CspA family cold shock protein